MAAMGPASRQPNPHAVAGQNLGACPPMRRTAMRVAPAPRRHPTRLSMIGTVRERYRALVAAGEIERDPGQESVVEKLAALGARLAPSSLAQKSSVLGWLFGRAAHNGGPVKGLYLYGAVG